MLILLTLFGIVGAYLYLRRRRMRRLHGHGLRGRRASAEDEEERVPLATYEPGEQYRDENGKVDRKGKGKARSTSFEDDREGGDSGGSGSTVFALGDEDEDTK